MSSFQPFYISVGEQRWLFDESELELKDYFVIKAATGLGRVAFLNGIVDEEPASLQALVWLLRRKDEPDLTLAAVNFRPAEMNVEPVTPVEEVPDPRPPVEGVEPTPTSASDEISTSISSPAGADSRPVMLTP